MNRFDVIVVGGGPGGYSAAVRSAQLGMKTALIERESLGGACVNWGCIPTKTLLKNAELAHLLTQGKTFGFPAGQVVPDYAAAQTRSRQVAKRQGKRVEALLKKWDIKMLQGSATLSGPGEITLSSDEKLTAKAIILATGGKPRWFKGLEPDGDKVITSREALALSALPASIAIVGAGPIGLEFATVWRRYNVEVTVLEALPRVLPMEDEEISREVAAQFTKAGIMIRTGVRVEGIDRQGSSAQITVTTTDGQETISAEKVLVAAGITPETEGLGLEALGVVTDRGYVVVDDTMRTNIPGLYAIGDLTGKLALAHTASAQAIIAAEAIAGRAIQPIVYENIPRCVFGHVEAASVGLTEHQAVERGYAVRTAKSPFLPNGKAVAINENAGFVKLVADDTGRLLGVHMVGPHVTELIAGATTLVSLGITVEQASRVIYPHPTLSEALMEGIHSLAGHAIHI